MSSDESFDTCYDSDDFSSLVQSGFDDPDCDPYRLDIINISLSYK